MICLKLNRFFYDPSRILQLSEFVWMIRSSVQVVFNYFLLIDATDRRRLEAIKNDYFSHEPIPPFIFREHSL